jgi:hypothetical protein
VIEHLFIDFPSYKKITTCSLCLTVHSLSKVFLIVNLPMESLDFIMACVEDQFSNQNNSKTCNSCTEGQLSINYQIQNHIFIEPVIIQKNKKKNEYLDLSTTLNNIPKMLRIIDKQFTIRGVVEFIPPVIKNMQSIGHFISYSYREHTDKWERNDDLSNVIKSVRQNTKANHCMILIYTI